MTAGGARDSGHPPRPRSTRGLRPLSTPYCHPWADAGGVPGGTVDGMSINMYVINAILVLMVIRQIREHPLDARSLAVPVLAEAPPQRCSCTGGRRRQRPRAGSGVRAGRRGHGRDRRTGHPAAARRRRAAAGPRQLAGRWHVDRRRRRPAGLRRGRQQRRGPGHRPVQHHAPRHRLIGLGGGAGHDGTGRRVTRLVVIWLRGRRLAARRPALAVDWEPEPAPGAIDHEQRVGLRLRRLQPSDRPGRTGASHPVARHEHEGEDHQRGSRSRRRATGSLAVSPRRAGWPAKPAPPGPLPLPSAAVPGRRGRGPAGRAPSAARARTASPARPAAPAECPAPP